MSFETSERIVDREHQPNDDALNHAAASEAQIPKAPGPDPDFPDWYPDLNGPHWQPAGGPNGEGFCIAIATPGRILTVEEQALLDSHREELANAYLMLVPADDDKAEDEGIPHRDPVGTAKTPRKLGNTETGWEVWENDDTRMYYFNRATKVTKYNWTVAEIEAENQRFARSNSSEKDDMIVSR